MKAEEERSRARARLIILFVSLALIAYYAILHSYFLSDDFAVIGNVLEGDWSVTWSRETGGFFRPLFILTCIVESRLWGLNPFGYHLTNTLLHALNSLLVYKLARQLLEQRELLGEETRRVPLMVGLLFLLHPSHTETVTWISGGVDLWLTLLALVTLLAFVSYMESLRLRYLMLSLLAFALALLSKESAIALPFMLFALYLFFQRAESLWAALKGALKWVAPFFGVLLLFIILRRVALGVWVGGYGAGQHLNFSLPWLRDRFLQACLRALFPAFPEWLAGVLFKPLKSPIFFLCAAAVIVLLLFLLKRRKVIYESLARKAQNRLCWLLFSLFLLSLLPVINLRMSLFNTQGERFVYWPSAFITILVAYALLILLGSKRFWLGLMLCLLTFYFVSLYRTNQIWSEAARLSQSIAEDLSRNSSPDKTLLVINAPDNLRGVPVFHNGLAEALRTFQKPRRTATRIFALQDLDSLSDQMELKREGEQLQLRLLNPADTFARIVENPDCVEILERTPNALRFRLGPCRNSLELYFFNQGKILKVLFEE